MLTGMCIPIRLILCLHWHGVGLGWLYTGVRSRKANLVVRVSLAGTTIEQICEVQTLTSFFKNLPE